MFPSSSQRFPGRCRRTPYYCLNPWPTYSSHEKFWPASENCLCLQIQFFCPLHIYIVGKWLWLPTRAQFWCSLKSNLSGQIMFISWKSGLTTCHWFCKLCEFFSVFCREVLSHFNRCQESCINTKFNHTILLWGPFNSFLVLLQQIFLCRIIGRRCRCFRQQTCWLKQWSDCPASTSLPVLTWQALYSLHKSETALLHTFLRLLRKYWTD